MRKILCLNTENESENKIQVKQYNNKHNTKIVPTLTDGSETSTLIV
jgi:hypothetical protein